MTEHRLKAVYFPGKGTRLGYRKAMVYDDEMNYFFDLGAYASPNEIPDEAEDEVDVAPLDDEDEDDFLGEDDDEVDGDKGTGKPGSVRWHSFEIRALRTKLQIADYVKNVTGKAFLYSKNAKMSELKSQALAKIKEKLPDDNSSD